MTQTEKPTIRRMTISDLEQVILLDRESFSLPWPESSFRFEIEKNEFSRCWVSEIGQNIVAMMVAWVIVDEVHIATFAVQTNLRRQGIARQLLVHTLLDAYHSGARKGYLEVRRGNLAARALYEKFGLIEIGIRKKYYQDNGEDAVMMNLEKMDIDLLESLR